MRLPDRFLARHALHAGLALSIPRLHAVFAVDDVESDRQRVDDPLDEAALLVVLPRAQRDLDLELPRPLGVGEPRDEHVRDHAQDEMVFDAERGRSTERNGAEWLKLIGEEGPDDDAVRLGEVGGEQRAHLVGLRCLVSGGGALLESTRAEGPEHALVCVDRGPCGVYDGDELVVLGLARGESRRDGGDSRERARCSNHVRVDGGDRGWAQGSSKVGRIARPASAVAPPRTR